MTRSPVAPGAQPGLLDHVALLPPSVRLAVGIAMLGMGVAAAFMPPFTVVSAILIGLSLMFGLPLLIGGVADRRRQVVESAERARAEAELPALREAVAAAVAARHNVGRLLRQRGYTSAKVRRWIALECDVVLPTGDHDA